MTARLMVRPARAALVSFSSALFAFRCVPGSLGHSCGAATTPGDRQRVGLGDLASPGAILPRSAS